MYDISVLSFVKVEKYLSYERMASINEKPIWGEGGKKREWPIMGVETWLFWTTDVIGGRFWVFDKCR